MDISLYFCYCRMFVSSFPRISQQYHSDIIDCAEAYMVRICLDKFPSDNTCTTRAEGWSGYSVQVSTRWLAVPPYRRARESVLLSRTKDRLSPGRRASERERSLHPMRRDPRSGTPAGPLAFIPKHNEAILFPAHCNEICCPDKMKVPKSRNVA